MNFKSIIAAAVLLSALAFGSTATAQQNDPNVNELKETIARLQSELDRLSAQNNSQLIAPNQAAPALIQRPVSSDASMPLLQDPEIAPTVAPSIQMNRVIQDGGLAPADIAPNLNPNVDALSGFDRQANIQGAPSDVSSIPVSPQRYSPRFDSPQEARATILIPAPGYRHDPADYDCSYRSSPYRNSSYRNSSYPSYRSGYRPPYAGPQVSRAPYSSCLGGSCPYEARPAYRPPYAR